MKHPCALAQTPLNPPPSRATYKKRDYNITQSSQHERESEAGGGSPFPYPPPVGIDERFGRVGDLNHRTQDAVHLSGVLRRDHPVSGAASHKSLEPLRRGVIEPHDHLVTVDLLADRDLLRRSGFASMVRRSRPRRRRRRGRVYPRGPLPLPRRGALRPGNDALRARHHRAVAVGIANVIAREQREHRRHGEVPAGLARGCLTQHEAVPVHGPVAHDDVEVLGELGVGGEGRAGAFEEFG